MGINKYEEILGLLQSFIRFYHLFIQMYALSSSTLSDTMLDSRREKKHELFSKNNL